MSALSWIAGLGWLAWLCSPLAQADVVEVRQLSIEVSIVGADERPQDIINRIELPAFLPVSQPRGRAGHTPRGVANPLSSNAGGNPAKEARDAAKSKRKNDALKQVPNNKDKPSNAHANKPGG